MNVLLHHPVLVRLCLEISSKLYQYIERMNFRIKNNSLVPLARGIENHNESVSLYSKLYCDDDMK